MNRRRLLSNIAVTGPIFLSGCLNTTSDDQINTTSNDTGENNTATADSDTDDTEEKISQGAAEPITTTVEDVDSDEYYSYDWDTICRFEAGAAVRDVIESELDTSLESVRVTISSETGLTIKLVTSFNRDGEMISSPNVSFDEVVAVTPKHVQMTAIIDGNTVECEDDVTVVHRFPQNL